MASTPYRTLLFYELESNGSRSAITITRLMLMDAYTEGASDIHIDSEGSETRIRLRIDGLLKQAYVITSDIHEELVARLKILSGLRTDEHFAAQDGRFQFNSHDEVQFDVRVSILPTRQGESVVLRLLVRRIDTSLEALGLTEEQRMVVNGALAAPHGLILMVGPTGSGKTTTLYSCIEQLTRTERSIVSIEDPIEYSLASVRQVQVTPHTGLTFAEGLRALLRQDPDIIVVGEVRDAETANIAVNAAFTGHLVLSTLHAGDTRMTAARLKELGVSEERLSLVRPLIISQRLVRAVCDQCKGLTSECIQCGSAGCLGRAGIFEVGYA